MSASSSAHAKQYRHVPGRPLFPTPPRIFASPVLGAGTPPCQDSLVYPPARFHVHLNQKQTLTGSRIRLRQFRWDLPDTLSIGLGCYFLACLSANTLLLWLQTMFMHHGHLLLKIEHVLFLRFQKSWCGSFFASNSESHICPLFHPDSLYRPTDTVYFGSPVSMNKQPAVLFWLLSPDSRRFKTFALVWHFVSIYKTLRIIPSP